MTMDEPRHMKQCTDDTTPYFDGVPDRIIADICWLLLQNPNSESFHRFAATSRRMHLVAYSRDAWIGVDLHNFPAYMWTGPAAAVADVFVAKYGCGVEMARDVLGHAPLLTKFDIRLSGDAPALGDLFGIISAHPNLVDLTIMGAFCVDAIRIPPTVQCVTTDAACRPGGIFPNIRALAFKESAVLTHLSGWMDACSNVRNLRFDCSVDWSMVRYILQHPAIETLTGCFSASVAIDPAVVPIASNLRSLRAKWCDGISNTLTEFLRCTPALTSLTACCVVDSATISSIARLRNLRNLCLRADGGRGIIEAFREFCDTQFAAKLERVKLINFPVAAITALVSSPRGSAIQILELDGRSRPTYDVDEDLAPYSPDAILPSCPARVLISRRHREYGWHSYTQLLGAPGIQYLEISEDASDMLYRFAMEGRQIRAKSVSIVPFIMDDMHRERFLSVSGGVRDTWAVLPAVEEITMLDWWSNYDLERSATFILSRPCLKRLVTDIPRLVAMCIAAGAQFAIDVCPAVDRRLMLKRQ